MRKFPGFKCVSSTEYHLVRLAYSVAQGVCWGVEGGVETHILWHREVEKTLP